MGEMASNNAKFKRTVTVAKMQKK